MMDSSVMITPIFDQLVDEFRQRDASTAGVGQVTSPEGEVLVSEQTAEHVE